MSRFEYSPLDPSRSEIRVLCPIPIRHTGDGLLMRDENPCRLDLSIHFALKVVSLEDKPIYTALSYHWGDPTAEKPVTIDGKTFLVTKNLYCALEHLRYDHVSPRIWVDSICINQADKDEKSDQVQRMKAVYASAARVLVWLGPATNDSDCVMEIMYHVGEQCRELQLPERDSSGPAKWPASPQDERLVKLYETLGQFLQREGAFKVVKAFTAFIARDWWKRVWVVQELAVAREVIFQAGEKQVPYASLDAAMSFWHHWRIEIVKQRAQIFSVGGMEAFDRDEFLHTLNSSGFDIRAISMFNFRKRYWNRESAGRKQTTLYELLNLAYTRSGSDTRLTATNPSDRIFGLIGLIEEDYRELELKVDYHKSTEEIYIETAEALLRKGYIDLLGLFQSKQNFNHPQELPSWCIDWRQEIIQPYAVNGTSGQSQFSASGTTSALVSPSLKLDGTSRILTISGVFVGSVGKAKEKYFFDSTPGIDILGNCGRVFSDVKELCAESAKLGTNVYSAHELEEAIWRIPVRDYEMPPGSFSKEPRKATRRVSLRRYCKFLSLVRSFKALGALSASFNQPDTKSLVSGIQLWPLRFFWGSKLVFFLGDFVLSRFNFLSRCRWWIKSKVFSLWTWVSSGRGADTALRRLRDQMATEWEDIVCDTAEMYFYPMSTNYPMRLFMTEQGFIGLGPETLKEGDVICIFFGAKAPHILRPQQPGEGQGGCYYVIGEAYVHGIMYGKYLESNMREVKDFLLI